MGNFAMLVDPQDGIFDSVGLEARLVDADMDGKLLAAGLFAQAQDKLALVHRLDEARGFGAGDGDVIACFGEEQRLSMRLSGSVWCRGA
jgi:hypothetical protein